MPASPYPLQSHLPAISGRPHRLQVVANRGFFPIHFMICPANMATSSMKPRKTMTILMSIRCYFLNRQPVRKMIHTMVRHSAKNPAIAARLASTGTSA